MATAFAAIANKGVVCEPIVVDRFVSASGEQIPGQQPSCRQGITPDVAAAAASPMRAVITGGTGTRSNPGGEVPVIGKTGTTDSQVQTWMVGSSTNVATSVWVGNVVGDYRLSRYRNGTVLRHDIFRIIMQAANEQYGGEAFPAPPERLLVGSGITVPDITGLTTDEAAVLLESIGLKLEVTTGNPGGRIGAFEPAAGTYLARGMIVRVVSGGGDGQSTGNLMMPSVVGLSVAAANQAMDGVNMTGARVFSCVAGSPGTDPNQGTVAAQSPGGGSKVWNYTGVQIQVTCGAAPDPSDDDIALD
jgi:membrane peptidoglycan carboxypeptidase